MAQQEDGISINDSSISNQHPKSLDFLVTALEFQLGPNNNAWPPSLEPENEDAWSGYDWKFSECGTPNPTPRPGYATLFVKYHQEQIDSIRIRQGHHHSQQDDPETLEDDDDRIRIYSNNDSTTTDDDSYCLRGIAYPQEDLVKIDNDHDLGKDDHTKGDPSASNSTWTMGVFHVASKRDYEFACKVAKEDPRHRCVLKHEQTNRVLEHLPLATRHHQSSSSEKEPDMTLCITTGMGPEEAPTRPDSPRFWYQRLSTRFELKSDVQVLIAKCHLSYRDDQWDPWIGPCIEAMSVNPLYRNGKGWLWVLWHCGVVPFLQESYALVEEDDHDSQEVVAPSIQVRVIHLLGSELDRIEEGDDTPQLKPIWDKDFYFGQVGFSILPRGLRTGVMNYLRPQDDQGIGYILIEAEKDASPDGCTFPKPQVGARYCQTCGKISKACFGCPNQCGGRVYYCSTTCREQDAPQHGVWCGLTRAQLHQVLVAKGRRVQDSNGVWKTVL